MTGEALIRRAPLLAAGVCVLGAIAFWFLAWQPMSEEREALDDERADLEQEASRLRNEIAALEDLKAQEAQLRYAFERHDDFLPVGLEQPAVVAELQEVADGAGVELEQMQFGDPARVDLDGDDEDGAPDVGEPGHVLASIQVALSLDGRYAELTDLLRRLEVEMDRALLVESLSLGSGSDGFPDLSASLSGQLFALVPTDEAADPDDVDDVTDELDAPDPDAEADDDPEDAPNGDDLEGEDLDDEGEDDDDDPDDDDDELQEAAP